VHGLRLGPAPRFDNQAQDWPRHRANSESLDQLE
jgi:hypothetical protein